MDLNLSPLPETLRAHRTRAPLLPPETHTLLRQLGNAHIDIGDIAHTLERFPSITARLIALANSAWSSPASRIVSLRAACTRLGLNMVRSVSLGLAVGMPFDASRCPSFMAERFWFDALLGAETAGWIKEAVGPWSPLDPQAARSAGLLRNLGLLWLTESMPAEVDRALTAAAQDPDLGLDEALRAHCGIDHHHAGAHLGQRWGLPEVLVVGMAHHGDPDYDGEYWQCAHLLGLTGQLVGTLNDDAAWAEAAARYPHLPLMGEAGASDELLALRQRAAARGADIRAIVKVLFPH
ncbi:MAG: HDOD domain-containing protein [Gammaproteobacteria bacterium]